MGKTKFLIYGGGGHFRVICSILEKDNVEIVGFFDRSNKSKGYKKISYLGEYDKQINPDSKIIVAVGNNIIREKISKKIKHSIGLVIASEATISSSIDHDCTINDFVHVAPGATLCGGVLVGRSTLIGAGTTILPNIKVGENVIIGAGSLVNKDIPDNSMVFGTPAKVIDNE